MRRVRNQVAASLDGFIAGPNGEYDWIPEDPDIKFDEFLAQIDAIFVGRKTFEMMSEAGHPMIGPEYRTVVFSRTLEPGAHPDIEVVGDEWETTVASMRRETGKDIWLFGGGELFRSLLEANLVDTVEIAVVPCLLGEGIPVLPRPATRHRLALTNQRVYERSGVVLLEYNVTQAR